MRMQICKRIFACLISLSICVSLSACGNKNTTADPEIPESAPVQPTDVAAALEGGVWYFNGGSETVLNRISFSDTGATLSQVYFDKDGKHENDSISFSYEIDEAEIHLKNSGGGQLDIPYSMGEDTVILGEKTYYTLEEIDAELHGYWRDRTKLTYGGQTLAMFEDNIFFDSGIVRSERASGTNDGKVYYFGPYEDVYTLNFGGFDTEIEGGDGWYFNIISGEVRLLHQNRVCERSDGFPGENGYSFT